MGRKVTSYPSFECTGIKTVQVLTVFICNMLTRCQPTGKLHRHYVVRTSAVALLDLGSKTIYRHEMRNPLSAVVQCADVSHI
jgi:hypothetical protein